MKTVGPALKPLSTGLLCLALAACAGNMPKPATANDDSTITLLDGGRYDGTMVAMGMDSYHSEPMTADADPSGAAVAVAIVLREKQGVAISESRARSQLLDGIDQALYQQHGQRFSLLDIKRVLKARGLDADGYRLATLPPRQELVRSMPMVAMLSLPSGINYIVIESVDDQFFYALDPHHGRIALTPQELLQLANVVVISK